MRASQGRRAALMWGTSSFVRRFGATGGLLAVAVIVALALSLVSSTSFAQASKTTAFPKPPGGVFGGKPKVDKTLPLYLQGDELVYDTKGNRVIARGNVEIFYNNNVLTADEIIYDQGANTLTASGNVEVKEENGNVIRADRYTLTDDFRDGFVQSLSVVTRDESRISAARGERRDGNVTEFTGASFTACKQTGDTPPLWCVGAKKIIHDKDAGTITYQDAEFKLYGITVAYLPWFETPDPNRKRKSGFLMPSYGSSDDLGFFTEIPYYFALAPNYDFTFRPRYMTEQGVLWQGDWRHRLSNGQYSVNFAAIDQQRSGLPSSTTNPDDIDGWRGSIETHGNFSASSWWSYGWDAIVESDDTFRRFYKLDSVLTTDRVDDLWLVGLSDRNYFSAKLYKFGGLLADDTNEASSLVYPVIDHNYVFQDPVLGGELSWSSNALNFTRRDSGTVAGKDQAMTRAVTEVKWRRRLTDTLGITYTPFGELRGDVYQIDNYVNPQTNAPIGDDTFVRGLATGGATVSYPWVANTGASSHVVEPIGQVVAHNGSVNQAGLPVEDAKSLIFDDSNLFESSKFSGYDRLETGVRANVGVQYTFQAPVGNARVLAGRSYHLSGTNAYADPGLVYDKDAQQYSYVFTPRSGLDTDKSDYVLGVYLAPTDIFRFISQTRFGEADFDVKREDLTAQVVYGPMFAQATYTYTSIIPELGINDSQQDLIAAAGLKLTDRWSVNAALRYDIDAQQTLTDSIQLAYLDECFMLSATYQETFIEDASRDIQPDRSIMLRFEFKHLGGFNYNSNVNNYFGTTDTTTAAVGN